MKKKILRMSTYLVTASLLAACSPGGQENQSGQDQAQADQDQDQLQVTASFFPVYEFAREVAGDRAQVDMILSSNQDAHSFEPSPQDIAQVDQSDVFVYSSDEMEFWAGDLLEAVENEDLVVAKAIDGMDGDLASGHDHEHDEDDHDHEHDEDDHDHDHGAESDDFIGLAGHYHTGDTAGLQANVDTDQDVTWFVEQDGQVIEEETLAHDEAFEHTLEDSVEVYYQVDGEESDRVELHVDDHEDLDPHIWLDPVYAQDQVNAIRDAFIEADPEGEEVYTQNAADFNKQLEELHQEYSQTFENAENRNFVVQHEAFGYLANRYDLNQVSIGGLSTEVEPSPARIAEVGDLVEEYQVPVIYYQEGADSSAAQTVADETGTDIAELYDLEILSDEMQAENLSYLDVMERNLDQLKLSIQ